MRFVFCLAPLMLAVALVARASAQDKEHPVAREVKASLKDASKPFTMVLHVKLKDGAAAKFESAFAKAIRETRKEKGNKAYDLNRSTKVANEYIIYERWQNLAALNAHLNSPHITTLLATIGDLLAEPPAVKVLVPAGE